MRNTTLLLILAAAIACDPAEPEPVVVAEPAPPPEPEIAKPVDLVPPEIVVVEKFADIERRIDDPIFERADHNECDDSAEYQSMPGDSNDYSSDRPFRGPGLNDRIGGVGGSGGYRCTGARTDGAYGGGAAPTAGSGQGALAGADGEFPLRHTDVHARVSGYLATVDVRQQFENPFDRAIEAVYTFPLPAMAAVNGFEMRIGARRIVGIVRPREEARRVYEQAKAAGYTASLLTQERPNIFTQNVANIAPKERVDVALTYVEALKYEDKHYEFVFPTVVAPRYSRGEATSSAPVAGRSGHDISLALDIDAGLPIQRIDCASHDVAIQSESASKRRVTLAQRDEIPNRDFVCRWTVAGAETQFGVLAHRGDLGGFLTLMIQPPAAPTDDQVVPREITFILDVSGSMNGVPINMAKDIIERTLDELRREDAFNVFTFANGNAQLWASPQPRTAENVAAAKRFLSTHSGAGGTKMLAGLRRALAATHDPTRLQMVCFLTDGHVKADREIIETIRDQRGDARFFAFGPGSSVNRYLLDSMGEVGRGVTQYADPRDADATSRAVGRFFDAIDSPVLVDATIDWNGLPVVEAFPSRLPDLFAGQTLNVVARYTGAAEGTAYVTGRVGAERVRIPVALSLPAARPDHAAIGSVWARHKIHELSHRDAIPVEEITDLAVDFQLVSDYTSFVAVDESRRVSDGKPMCILQPVELPEWMSRDAAPHALRAWGLTVGMVDGRVQILVGAGSMRTGDVIESINGTAVLGLDHFESLLSEHSGQSVAVGVAGRRVAMDAP